MTEPIGRNIERLRKLRGMKQQTLASLLAISQQAVSKIERSECIDGHLLRKIAVALGTSEECIRHFTDVFESADLHAITSIQAKRDFPLEKIVELYERLLEAEREKNEVLITALQKIKSNK